MLWSGETIAAWNSQTRLWCCFIVVLDSFIWEKVATDFMQFGFVQGGGVTDAIFIIHQLQEKYIAANKPLYFALTLLTWRRLSTVYPGKFFGGP